MKLCVEIAGRTWYAASEQPWNIAIPLRFNNAQPNTYDVPIAAAAPFEDGSFIGDTRKGGGCNFERYQLIPHCNGTHTEGVGHIAYERISIQQILQDMLFPGTLITIQPEKADQVNERYLPELNPEDSLITSQCILQALREVEAAFLKALIIRTLPNTAAKLARRYMKEPPAFFSIEAMETINQLGVEHLLVDLPSVDRMLDEGRLTCHHIFWNVAEGTYDVDPHVCSLKTITEMIYAPDAIADGHYLLSIQIPAFAADAAPSRPLLLPLSPARSEVNNAT